jgi:putative nucleotidyltransferase with HDIG domain
MEELSLRTKGFVGLTALSGTGVLVYSLWHWQSADLTRFICYLAVALLASVLKVQLPGIDGTMSVNFLFILMGVMELSLAETLVIGCAATLLQSIWHLGKRLDPVKVIFNVGMMANASALTYVGYHWLAVRGGGNKPILLMVAALVFFFANTVPISFVIALTEGKSARRVWAECYFWSFPYYLVGAAAVGLVGVVNRQAGWATSLLVLPLIYWVYRSYRLYLGRLEAEKERVEVEKRHVEEIASLNMRTIEALALAIEAKDHTTHTHLHRVRTYAVEIAKELNLSSDETEALRAAALLHDIGKLAVPEQIISKPGRLTPEEFEKMKVHPLVGAEILERVAFPYAVAPIVRSHHERWDGSGYPDGLRGEEIPIGARILAAVDCLDALASHRQYRPALPLIDAMAGVKERAGTWFDPRVVEILDRRFVELERLAQIEEKAGTLTGLSKTARVRRGAAPAAGFEKGPEPTTIGQARQHRLPDFHRFGTAGSADHVRAEPGSGRVPQLERNAFAALDAAAAADSLRFHRGVCEPQRVAAAGTGEWREFPHALVTESSCGRGIVRMGGGKLQTHREWQSAGGGGIRRRSGKAHHAAIGVGGSTRRLERRGRSAGYVPREPRRVHSRTI